MTPAPLPHTARRTAVLGLLLTLLASLVTVLGSSSPASADGNPCRLIKGPAREYCEKGQREQPIDKDTTDCKVAPIAARPQDGVAGNFANPPKNAPAPIDPKHPKAKYHLYEQYSLAGHTWQNYDTGCTGDAGAWAQTAVANVLMDGARWWTGLALEMQQQATDSGYLSQLNPVFADATKKVKDAVFTPWIGISVLLLGTVLVWQSRSRSLNGTVQAAGWALLVMTLATAAFSYPAAAGRLADTAITGTVGQVQQAVVGDATGKESPAISQGNLLAGTLLYDQWLDGELGSSDSKTAKTYGLQLFDAQTMSWAETRLPKDERQKVVQAKADTWQRIAAKIKKDDPTAYGHLTGHSSGRIWAAVMACVSVTPAVLFTIAVGVVLACALLVVRLAVLFAPAIAPLAIHRQAAGVMRSLGATIAACLVHAPLFALAGAIDILLIRALLSPDAALPQWFAVLLMYVLTFLLWRMAKPLRSLSSLASPDKNFLGEGVGMAGAPGRGIKSLGRSYLRSRLSSRQMARHLSGGRRRGSTRRAGRGTTGHAQAAPETASEEETTTTGSGTEKTAPSADTAVADEHRAAPEDATEPTTDGTRHHTDTTTGTDVWRPESENGDDTPPPAPDDPPSGTGRGSSAPLGPGTGTRPHPLRTPTSENPAPLGPDAGTSPHPLRTPPRTAGDTSSTRPPAPTPGTPPGSVARAGEGENATPALPGPERPAPADYPDPVRQRPPHVVAPTTAADGTTLYTIWTPGDGYGLADSGTPPLHDPTPHHMADGHGRRPAGTPPSPAPADHPTQPRTTGGSRSRRPNDPPPPATEPRSSTPDDPGEDP